MTEAAAELLRVARARQAYLSEAIGVLSFEIGELHKHVGSKSVRLAKLLRIYQRVLGQIETIHKHHKKGMKKYDRV